MVIWSHGHMRAPPPPTLPTGFYQLGNIARLGAGGAGILWYDGEGWAELGTRHVNSSQRGTISTPHHVLPRCWTSTRNFCFVNQSGEGFNSMFLGNQNISSGGHKSVWTISLFTPPYGNFKTYEISFIILYYSVLLYTNSVI